MNGISRRVFLNMLVSGGLSLGLIVGFRNLSDYLYIDRPVKGGRIIYMGDINGERVAFYTYGGRDRTDSLLSLIEIEADVLEVYNGRNIVKEFWDFDGKGIIGDHEFDKVVIYPTNETLNSKSDRKLLEQETKEYQNYLSKIMAKIGFDPRNY